MLRVGKHRGLTFEHVAQNDKNYCAWVLRETHISTGLKTFQNHLRRTHGGLMQCGRHRNKWFNEIVAEEPDYAAWVLGLNSPGPAMEQFIDYLVKICGCRKEAPDDEAVHAPEAKKPRVTPPAPPDAAAGESKQTPKLCHICYSQAINAVFVPCGHLAACNSCAKKCGDTCPICKADVIIAMRIYEA